MVPESCGRVVSLSLLLMEDINIVGQPVRRVEATEKVTGRARFTGDLEFPGLLEGRVLRSPFPHAVVNSIDVSAAEAIPGVVGVLSRGSVRDIDPYYCYCLRDRPLIATGRVRYAGEPVVAVAAESEEIAERALAAVRVRYQELPTMGAAEVAVDTGALLVGGSQRPVSWDCISKAHEQPRARNCR